MKNILSEVDIDIFISYVKINFLEEDIDICISFCLALVSNMINCPRKIFSLSVNNRNELLMYFYGLLWKLGDIKHIHRHCNTAVLGWRWGLGIIKIILILITSGVTQYHRTQPHSHS